MAALHSRVRDPDGVTVSTSHTQATSAVSSALQVRHWVFDRLGEHSRYRDYLSDIFVRRRRQAPDHALSFIKSDVPDVISSRHVQLEVGKALSRLDIVCHHYLWPYNSKPGESIGSCISEAEAELLGSSDAARRARGELACSLPAGEADEDRRTIRQRGQDGNEVASVPETVAPITSFGGNLRGAIAVFRERMASSLHAVLHAPGPPHDLLFADLAELLLELLAALPIDQLQGHAQSPRRRYSPDRSVAYSHSSKVGASTVHQSSTGRMSSTGSVHRSPVADRRGRSMSPHSKTVRETPVSTILTSAACMDVISCCTLYVYWTVLHPWHAEWERRQRGTNATCAACKSPDARADIAKAEGSGEGPANTEGSYLSPNLSELAGRITRAWAHVESMIQVQSRRAASQSRPMVLLAVRTVVELYLQQRYTWFCMLQAVAAAVDRQFPMARTEDSPSDALGIVRYVCSSTALWKDIDRVTSQLLDPSRLGSHMATAESGESARRLSQQVRQELERARIQANRKELAVKQGLATQSAVASPAPTSYSPKQWLVATSPGTTSWTRDMSSPAIRRFLNSQGTSNRTETSHVLAEQGWEISLAKIRESYAQGRRPVAGLQERMEILAGVVAHPRQPHSSSSRQMTAGANTSPPPVDHRTNSGPIVRVPVPDLPPPMLLSAAAASDMQHALDLAFHGSPEAE